MRTPCRTTAILWAVAACLASGCYLDLGVHVQKVEFEAPEMGGTSTFAGDSIDTTLMLSIGFTWQSPKAVAMVGYGRSGLETGLETGGTVGVGQNMIMARADLLPAGKSFGDGRHGLVVPLALGFGTGSPNFEDTTFPGSGGDGSALLALGGIGYGMTLEDANAYLSGSVVGRWARHTADTGNLKAIGAGFHITASTNVLFGDD